MSRSIVSPFIISNVFICRQSFGIHQGLCPPKTFLEEFLPQELEMYCFDSFIFYLLAPRGPPLHRRSFEL